MMTEISEWLQPLLDAAEHEPGIDLWAIMQQATKPLTRVPEFDLAERLGGRPDLPDLTLAVDWVQFGQLLRHALDWDDCYPEQPAETG
jgi:hypothetical protein